MNSDIFENLNKNRYFRNFKKDKKLIFSAMLIVLVWSFVYLLFFYKAVYKSTAKIWIKDLATEEFVASLDTQNQMQPLTAAGNPILTQIEILKSDQLKRTIVEYKAKQGDKVGINSIDIDVKNKPSTDILSITLGDGSPKKAQDTLIAVLEEYDNINLLINRKISTARRKYIEEKLAEIDKKLREKRSEIEKFKSANLAISIDEESRELVAQKIEMSSKLEDIKGSMKNTQSSLRELERQLSLKPKDAIRAVALGTGNQTLNQLRSDLNIAMQQYEFDSAKLADTNPKMVAQKTKIDTINKQIKEQVRLTVGKYTSSHGINIYDPVRSELVKDLADYQTRFIGLQAEEKALNGSIQTINLEQSKIPQKKFTLDMLEQEERALSSAYEQCYCG